MSPLHTNDERLSSRGSTSALPLTCQGPTGHFNDPTAICESGARKQDTAYEQSQCHGGIGNQDQSATTQQTTGDYGVRVLRLLEAPASQNSRPTKAETINTSAQTDNAENFYVSREILLAYMIAVVQNTQAYHFGQMSVLFQTVQNKAALETPSRAEEFTKNHFNLKLLTDKENCKGPLDATTNKRKASLDATPINPTQETIPKVVESSHSTPNQRPQLTGTVPLLVNLRRGLATAYLRVTRVMTLGVAILIMVTLSNRRRT